ncbi:MAG: oxidoreductase, partial [Devosia sp.]
VRATIFWPGAVRTGMRAKAMPGENAETLLHPRDIVGKLVNMVSPGWTENRVLYDVESGETRPL